MAELTQAGDLVSRVLPPTPTGPTTPLTAKRPSPSYRLSGTPAKCPKCNGFGWLQFDVPVGHPQFKDTARCDVCGSGKQQDYLRALSGLAGEQLIWTFGNTKRNDANGAAFDAAELLAGNPQRFLALLSPAKYGVGKTRLLACIINAARMAGHTAIYTTTADVLDYLRSAYAPNADVSYDGRFDTLRNARVLALDEFDRWAPTAWAQEKFFQLIDYRYRNATTLLTVFAANSDISILPGYIASRMNDVANFVFILNGQDVRRVRRN
jgi:DNA replication protein DnaC